MHLFPSIIAFPASLCPLFQWFSLFFSFHLFIFRINRNTRKEFCVFSFLFNNFILSHMHSFPLKLLCFFITIFPNDFLYFFLSLLFLINRSTSIDFCPFSSLLHYSILLYLHTYTNSYYNNSSSSLYSVFHWLSLFFSFTFLLFA